MRSTHEEPLELSLGEAGKGPLLQRDYWATIRNCRISPQQFGALLAIRFADFAPRELTRFERVPTDAQHPLRPGDELRVHIRLAGTFGVRVLHVDANSITFGTLRGHPEAGRITFGAYRGAHGHVVFHIRSRARSSSSKYYAGFRALGEPMQLMTWTDFIDRLANTVGRGVLGRIHEETHVLASSETDTGPTYLATGD